MLECPENLAMMELMDDRASLERTERKDRQEKMENLV